MAWVLFENQKNQKDVSSDVQISVAKNGAACFSREAIKEFGIDSFKHVKLFYNKKKKKVGLKLLKRCEPASFKLTKLKYADSFTLYSVCLRSLYSSNRIKKHLGNRHELTKKGNMLVFNLN